MARTPPSAEAAPPAVPEPGPPPPRLGRLGAGVVASVFGLIAAAAVLAGARYAWNPAAPWISVPFFLCQVALIAVPLRYLAATAFGRAEPSLPPPPPGDVAVDVLIPTYDEAPALLRRTVRRALAIRYPHRTMILDDGGRPAVRDLAAELGCGYLSRPDRGVGGKAGNLNAGLGQTTGELVLVLDADGLADARILDRTLGYFANPAVALVQTPQVFYNVDALDEHYDPVRREHWSASALFHQSLQLGFARCNAALCTGSAFIFRRRAIESVGGIPVCGGGEDTRLSLLLAAARCDVRYHAETLAYHLGTDGLGQFWTQRVRWARSEIELWGQILGRRGLTLAQRLVFANVASQGTLGIFRFALRALPAVAAILGLATHAPGFEADRFAVAVVLAAIALSYALPALASRFGYRLLLRRALGVLITGPSAAALLASIFGRPFRFITTPKGAGAPAPAAAYLFPVIATGLGAAGTIAALSTVGAAPGRALSLAMLSGELLVTGALALAVTRGRGISREVATIATRRAGRFTAAGDPRPASGAAPTSALLEVVRLGAGEAFATGPATLEASEGTLRIALDDGEHEVRARLERAPATVVPAAPPGEACYRLILDPGPAARDRLTDAIDAVEIPRFFASLARRSCVLPPGSPSGDPRGIPLYRVRPSLPAVLV